MVLLATLFLDLSNMILDFEENREKKSKFSIFFTCWQLTSSLTLQINISNRRIQRNCFASSRQRINEQLHTENVDKKSIFFNFFFLPINEHRLIHEMEQLILEHHFYEVTLILNINNNDLICFVGYNLPQLNNSKWISQWLEQSKIKINKLK